MPSAGGVRHLDSPVDPAVSWMRISADLFAFAQSIPWDDWPPPARHPRHARGEPTVRFGESSREEQVAYEERLLASVLDLRAPRFGDSCGTDLLVFP